MSDLHDAEKSRPQVPQTTGQADAEAGDVLDIIADVEGRLERLRKVSRESGAVVDSLHHQQAALRQKTAEIEQRARELEQAAEALRQRTGELDQREKHAESLCELADSERREIEQARAELAAARESLERDRLAFEQQRGEIERTKAEVAAREQALEREEAEAKRLAEKLNEQRARLETEHQAAMQSTQQRIAEIQNQRQERAETLAAELADARSQAAALSEHLESLRAETKKAEQAHRAEAERAALRADSLQADLDAAQRRSDEWEQAAAAAKRDLDSRHQQLEAAKRKLVELGKALDGQAEQIEAGVAALAALAERDARIADLESQLAAGRGAGGDSGGADPAELAARDQRIAELEQEIRSLESQAKAAAQTASTPGEDTDEEIAKRDQAIEQLSEHIRSLQKSLKEAQSETAHRAGEVEQLRAAIGKLKSPSAGSSGRDDEFTARRRQRIGRMRQAIRERSRRLNKARDVVKQHAQQAREIEDEKRTLSDVRRNLELAEQRMIRRWARSSVVTHLFLLTLTIAVLGAVSYFGVMTFWPTSYTARAAIEAKGKPGFPLTETQTNLWQTVHEQMVLSDGVINAVAERLRQRGYTDLAEPDQLRRFLEANLAATSSKPGTINFELTTVGRDEAQRLLETYSIGFVSASNAERGRRTDGATTNLSAPATVDSLPVKDSRGQIAGIAFGSSVGALLLLGLPLYLKLRRSASVFDDGDLDSPLLDTERWRQIGHGASPVTEHVIS